LYIRTSFFKSDVKGVVGKLSSYVPYLRIVSGGLTVGNHVYRKTPKPQPPPPPEEEPKEKT
jgi:hypothetical protein